MDLHGAACEAVAVHCEQAVAKQIRLPGGQKRTILRKFFREIKEYFSI